MNKVIAISLRLNPMEIVLLVQHLRLVKKNDKVYSTCLAGSIARGKNAIEDELLGKTLLKDEKNLIEHQFVVEMIKAAIEDSCSEVNIPERPYY